MIKMNSSFTMKEMILLYLFLFHTFCFAGNQNSSSSQYEEFMNQELSYKQDQETQTENFDEITLSEIQALYQENRKLRRALMQVRERITLQENDFFRVRDGGMIYRSVCIIDDALKEEKKTCPSI